MRFLTTHISFFLKLFHSIPNTFHVSLSFSFFGFSISLANSFLILTSSTVTFSFLPYRFFSPLLISSCSFSFLLQYFRQQLSIIASSSPLKICLSLLKSVRSILSKIIFFIFWNNFIKIIIVINKQKIFSILFQGLFSIYNIVYSFNNVPFFPYLLLLQNQPY